MKRILSFILLLFMLCIPSTLANSNVTNIGNYHNLEINYLYDINSNITYIDEFCYNIYDTGYLNMYEFRVEGEIKNYIVNDNYLYILYVNSKYSYIYKQNLKDSSIEEIQIEGILDDLILDNEYIYLVGTYDDDAIIYIYELDLDYVSQHQYGGEGKERFINIEIINNTLYLFGIKDAISKGSEFLNNGNTDEIKSFVITLDNEYKIKESLYINEKYTREEISSMIINDNKIFLNIMNEVGNYFQYVLDENLNVIEHFFINLEGEVRNVRLVDTYNMDEEYIYVYIKDNNLYYSVFTNKLEYSYLIKENVISFYYAEIINGILNIYCNYKDEMHLFKLSEYHVNKIDKKIVDYKDNTYDATNHFEAKSYFEPLEFKYDYELNDHIKFNKTMNTEAFYSALNQEAKKIIIKTPYVVNSHINIVNGGIYQIGYQLVFSDDAYMDDKRLYNGDAIKEEGKHKITHIIDLEKDIKKEYYIYVTSNYYKEFIINNIKTNVTLNKNERYYYELNLSDNKKVSTLNINDEPFDFLQTNNKINICFNASEHYGIENYYIDKIIFEDKTELIIDKLITIKTVKEKPVIDIYYIDDKIIYDVVDKEKAIIDLKIKFYQNDKLIKEEITYLDDYQLILPEKNTKVEIYLLYEIGTNEIYEELLFNLDGSSRNNKIPIFEIKYVIDDEIQQILLTNIKTDNSNINTANISNTSLNNLFVNENNNLLIFLTLGLTFVITVTICVIVIYRHKKKN